MKAASSVIAVRVVLATGKRFHGTPMPLHVMAKAAGPNTRAIHLPWRSANSQDDFDITVASDHELTSLAREVAVSSGWNDERLIVVYADPSARTEPLDASAVSGPLNRVAERARAFETRIDYIFHSLDLEPAGSEGALSGGTAGLVDEIVLATGGSFAGPMEYSDASDLAACLRRTRFLRNLGSAVLERMTEGGLRPLTGDAADALVQRYVETIQQNGFDVAFESHDALRALAPRIAAISEKRNA